jgi:hypothetical protein
MVALMKNVSMRFAGISREIRVPEQPVHADGEFQRVRGSVQRQTMGQRTLSTAMASGSELPRSTQEHVIGDLSALNPMPWFDWALRPAVMARPMHAHGAMTLGLIKAMRVGHARGTRNIEGWIVLGIEADG